MVLKRREWQDMNELAFNVVLGEELERYTKTTPQHVKAAKILQKSGVELRAGDLITFRQNHPTAAREASRVGLKK